MKTTKRLGAEDQEAIIEQSVDGDLQDQQAALEKILKAHGTYRDSEMPKTQINVQSGTNIFTQINTEIRK